MEINKYAEWTGNTCAKLANKDSDIIHMLFGLSTEVGELTDVFKKNLAYGKPVDWTNVEEEIGDLMFYLACFCRINNLDLNEIIEKNVRKLEARYPDKFTKENALTRDLEKERLVLEEKMYR